MPLQPRSEFHHGVPCLAMNAAPPAASVTSTLNDREIEVLSWIAEGKSDWEIGSILGISPKTVNYHVENAKRRCRVATRMQLIVMALRNGLFITTLIFASAASIGLTIG